MLCLRKRISEEKKISKMIDRELKSDKKRLDSVQQILLLGTGESGKSTIIKQMKILHIKGFSEQEKRDYIPSIRLNVHESIFSLIDGMSKVSPQIKFEVVGNEKLAQYILGMGPNPSEFTREYYDIVELLWVDPGVKKIYARANEFQLIDSAAHFLDRISAIRNDDYVPTIQDVLFCRVTTKAISKIEFKIPYKGQKVEFWMYDIGGQRGERKKWISVFEGIGTILFLIAASDFDQTLREDGKTNRLKEGFKVFADIFWSSFVRKAGKLVFLNKQDLLKKKIENGKSLAKYFPAFDDYEKSKNDYDRAKLFMRDMILHIATTKPSAETIELMPGIDLKQEVNSVLLYIHFTVATDTHNVKLVFSDVKDIIMAMNLDAAGLI